MNLLEQLQSLKDKPFVWLTEPCVLALGAFLFGYKGANSAINGLLERAAHAFASSAEADVCSRAYLSNARSDEALHAVLTTLIEMVETSPTTTVTEVFGPAGETHIVQFVREALLSGRTGMVLLEPTISWFANYVSGHTTGLRTVNPDLAESQADSFKRFERWLRERYGESTAAWYAVLRVYEGADIHGLRRFIELWDEWKGQEA